jgi:hypothetical protein
MAGPRSERFHNRDNGILRNKYRLGKLRKDHTGLGLWHQPTNISSTSSSVSRLPRGASTPGIRCVYCKWRKYGATWPRSRKPVRTDLKPARTDLPKKVLCRFQPIPRHPENVGRHVRGRPQDRDDPVHRRRPCRRQGEVPRRTNRGPERVADSSPAAPNQLVGSLSSTVMVT